MVDIPLNFSWRRLHPFGKRVVALAAVAAALFLLALPSLFWAAAAVAVAAAFFFRNPERVPPVEKDAVVAPADGIVVAAKNGPRPHLAIVLSLWDVHIIRMPWTCRVVAVRAKKGAYLPAYRAEASAKNARVTVDTRCGAKGLQLVLISGSLARKIECLAKPRSNWRLGQRLGLIYLGSRVEVRLPVGSELAVRVGQRTVGGETVLARPKR